MNKPYYFTLSVLIPAILFFAAVFPFSTADAQTPPQTLAALPFTINADKDINYVKTGISRMFYSRLSWPGKVAVIPPEKLALVLTHTKDVSNNDLVKVVGEKTGSQFVLSGTITQLAGSFSIDARIYDMNNKRYMAFFEQSKNSDELIAKVDRIAAGINHRVFERTTVTWEAMEQEKQKHLNDLKRKNPEHLMQVPQGWQPEEEVGWKVWKYLF